MSAYKRDAEASTPVEDPRDPATWTGREEYEAWSEALDRSVPAEDEYLDSLSAAEPGRQQFPADFTPPF